MYNLDKAPDILDRAFAEWKKVETLKREKTSVSRFADFLGYSQQSVNFWLHRDRKISEEALITILPKLAELLGENIYDELNVEKPDHLLNYVTNNWKKTSKDKKEKIAKLIEEDTKRPIPNEPRTKLTKS
jgi:uncharacterized membrane-anchored protein YjiN (DUF445 family)